MQIPILGQALLDRNSMTNRLYPRYSMAGNPRNLVDDHAAHAVDCLQDPEIWNYEAGYPVGPLLALDDQPFLQEKRAYSAVYGE